MNGLKELVQESRMGRITDRNDIEKILGRMGRMSWGEMLDIAGGKTVESGMIMVRALLEEWYGIFPEGERIRDLGFPEVLCLLDKNNFGKSPYMDREEMYEDDFIDEDIVVEDLEEQEDLEAQEEEDCEEWEEEGCEECEEVEDTKYFDYIEVKARWERECCCYMVHMLNVLEEAQKGSKLLRLFLGIDAQTLFDWMPFDEIPEEWMGEPWGPGEDLSYTIEVGLNVSLEGLSVGRLFKKMQEFTRKSWNPWEPIEDYEQRVLRAYDVCQRVLVESFRAAFPEQFCKEQVIEKLING